MQYRNDIQGLRAVAVVFVLFFHMSNSWLPGGFIGVDVFFVISGFLITKIITSKIGKHTFSVKEFYISRLKRIVPAYYFLFLFVIATFLYIFIMPDLGNFRLSYFWALIFNSNYYFATLDDYFNFSSNENPLLHTWTLGVEMQFYVFLPFILLIKSRKIISVLLLFLILTLFTYASVEIFKGNKGLMYFSLLARTPEFLIGSLVAFINLDRNAFIQRNKNIIAVFSFFGLLLSALLITEQSFFPGIGALPPVILAAMLLCTHNSFINNFLSRKIPFYIGELSYSIYLWHWPIISFIRYYNARYELTGIEICTVIAVTVLGSLLSFYLVEKPLRSKSGLKFYAPMFLLVLVNILFLFFLVPLKRQFTINFPKEYEYPQEFISSSGLKFKKVGVLGDPKYAGKKLLLIGDSHAHIFTNYIDKLGKKEHFSMRVITNSFIPTFPDLKETEELKNNVKFQKYKSTLQKIVIKEIESADIVVVMVKGDGAKWVDNLKNLIKQPDKKILLIKDYPHLDIHPVRVNRSFIKDSKKDYHYTIYNTQSPSSIKELAYKNKNFKIVDFKNESKFFRDAPFLNDTLIYCDQDHLNYYGVRRYVDFTGSEFMKYLNWAIEK